jgi:hypothetical protein
MLVTKRFMTKKVYDKIIYVHYKHIDTCLYFLQTGWGWSRFTSKVVTSMFMFFSKFLVFFQMQITKCTFKMYPMYTGLKKTTKKTGGVMEWHLTCSVHLCLTQTAACMERFIYNLIQVRYCVQA